MSLTPNQITEQIRGQLGVDISRPNDAYSTPNFPLPQLEEDYKGTQKGKFRREEFSFSQADKKRYDTAKDRVVIKFLDFKRAMWNNLFDVILQQDPQGRDINVEDENFDEELSSGKWLVAFNIQMPFVDIMLRYDKLVEARQNRKGNQKYKKNFEERCFEYLMLWWNSTPDFVKMKELKKISEGYYNPYNFFRTKKSQNPTDIEDIEKTTNKQIIKKLSTFEEWDAEYPEEELNLEKQSEYIDTLIFKSQEEKEDIVGYSIGKVLEKVDRRIQEDINREKRKIYLEQQKREKEVNRLVGQIISPIIQEDILPNVMEQIPMSLIEDDLYKYEDIRGNKIELVNYFYNKEQDIDDDLTINITDTEEEQRKQGFYVKKFFYPDLEIKEPPNRALDLVEKKSLGGFTQLDFETGIINQYFNYNVDRLRNIPSVTLKTINKKYVGREKENLLIPLGDSNFRGLVGAENKKGYYWDKSGYAFQERLYMVNPNNLGFYANQSFLGSVIYKVKIAFSKRTNTITYTHLPIGYFYLPPTTDLKIRRGRFTKIKDLLVNRYKDEHWIITKNAGFNSQMPTTANDKSVSVFKKEDGKTYTKVYPNYPTFIRLLYSVFDENRYLEDDNTEGFDEETMEDALNKMNILIKNDFFYGLKNVLKEGFRYGLSKKGYPVARLNGEFLTQKELKKVKDPPEKPKDYSAEIDALFDNFDSD